MLVTGMGFHFGCGQHIGIQDIKYGAYADVCSLSFSKKEAVSIIGRHSVLVILYLLFLPNTHIISFLPFSVL